MEKAAVIKETSSVPGQIAKVVARDRQFNIAKMIGVGLLGGLSVLYLANPTGGIMELIPDNLPILGNVDEAGMTLMLVYAIRYFKDALASRG